MIVNVYIEDDRSLKENLLLTNNPSLSSSKKRKTIICDS